MRKTLNEILTTFFQITSFAFSSLKKRETTAKRTSTEADDSEKAEKSKTDGTDAKSGDEKDPEKKKSVKKTTTEGGDNKETESIEGEGDFAAEGDEMTVDKSDNEDADDKGDDKEKRKKFVRLWCVHCRVESATFKVQF